MNKEQRVQVTEYCKQFDTKKLIECADAHYQGQPWDSTMIESYSIEDCIQLTNRIFKQVKEATAGEDYIVYPWEHIYPTLGSNTLGSHLSHILACIDQKKPFAEFVQSIQWMVKYLFDFNLWNKARAKIDITGLEEKQVALETLSGRMSGELGNLDKIKSDYEAEKMNLTNERAALTQFIEQKKVELTSIAEAVPTVTNQKADVDAVHKGVQQVDADIRAVQKNHGDLYEQLKTQKETQEKEFKASQEKIAEDDAKLKLVITAGEEKIKYFQSLDDFIREKQKEIIRLTGLAADGSLGHTFNARKDELKGPVRFWKWAMPVMTLLTVAWVVAVFTQFFTALPTSIEWGVVVMNIVKTVPMFVLLGFTVNQYTKERNLQEEYAFKAAVAMTITAYSDKLTDQKNKEMLVMDSVQKIYSAPKIQSEKSGSIFSFGTKKLTDTVKGLTDAVKQIKN